MEYEGTPLCTMVLANGQYMFSCEQHQGRYDLDVPSDSNGQVTLFCFADGFAPYSRILTPSGPVDYDIEMTRAPADSRSMTVTTQIGAGTTNPAWVRISGSVSYEGIPLCAMVLANGQHMFSCGTSLGSYDLEVPPDANGEITLFGFADGFLPSRQTLAVGQSQRIQPGDFEYLGAFRLPGGDIRPQTFLWGGNAMTFNPSGDAGGSSDGFPGSLFVMGHDRMAYGDLPDGNQVAELSIPVPVISNSLSNLGYAGFVQGFSDVAAGFFTDDELEELPRVGMEYLDVPATGPKIHLAWGGHFQPEVPVESHAWFEPVLTAPDMQGTWFIGNEDPYAVNGYLFEIPAFWADAHASGRYLGTGRFRDGGWSGMGPTLFAYRPWVDETGTPAAPGTRLEDTLLLQYESSQATEDVTYHALEGYQHPDEWEGGAWLTTTTGKSAVLFAGTKGTGAKYWYGWVNPAGPEYPCVQTEFIGTVCRLADGSACPAEDLTGCVGHNEFRGWWSASFEGRIILYDPDDLARVAAGDMESWEPQPYAHVDIDSHLFRNPAGIEPGLLGEGVQRRYLIGPVAYDRSNDLLYVLEMFADDAKPVVHVWRVR